MGAGTSAVRRIALQAVDSTNADALRRMRAGESGPLWVTAESQSAGRGRGGNVWLSPRGNLYATLLLREPSPPRLAPQLAFVAGLALHDAVAACASSLAPSLRLKWPNDLLLGERKLAGVLIEAENTPVFAVAVGIGINCTSHPADARFPATDLKAAGAMVGVEQMFNALDQAMQSRLTQWQKGAGFADARRDWLKRAARLGESIQVRLPERELIGIFSGLDETGCLMLDTGGKTEMIAAGEVFALGAQN
jgi:BirA family biotin operon repressor/biotin-[acetyl-CoA-carboxylase] ligase